MCNVKGHLKCNTVFFIKTHWRLDSNIVFSSEDRSSAFVFCFLFLIISTLAQCIFVYLFFLEYLCYSESFVRKSRKWHTALKKKKVVLLNYWTSQSKKICLHLFDSWVPVVLLFICISELAVWNTRRYHCRYLLWTCTECTVHTVQSC